ncbi:MAG: thioredoxin-dependent thiol peroxidase [Deltaproteobacteria bacterium]|nr:thioredoxin-dependent thiol peroxidase [Deltaproteobacteria bacterium]
MLKEGDKAIDFKLAGIDENGNEKEFSLKDFKGKKVVLYFYPKDNTPGCTQEACDFRDNMSRLVKDNVAVLGVSPDSINSHKKFKEQHGLAFPLLSDPDRKIASLYGAYGEKQMYGKTSLGIIRSTFLIDAGGKLEKAWRGVKAAGHVDEVLKTL